MTVAKIEGKPAAAAASGLEPWIGPLYHTPSKRVLGVVELAHVERVQVAPDADKEPSVKLRITHLEIAREEQEDALREALAALHLHRTAYGTLNEDGDLELSESTIERTGGRLHAVEAARLRAAVQHWWTYARNVTALGEADQTVTGLLGELKLIADGLDFVLHQVDREQD